MTGTRHRAYRPDLVDRWDALPPVGKVAVAAVGFLLAAAFGVGALIAEAALYVWAWGLLQ